MQNTPYAWLLTLTWSLLQHLCWLGPLEWSALTHFNNVCNQSQLRTERSMCGGLWVVCIHRPIRKGARNNESERTCPWALVLFLEWLCDRMCLCLCKKTEDNTYKAILQNCRKRSPQWLHSLPDSAPFQPITHSSGSLRHCCPTLITNDLCLQVTGSDPMQSWGKISYFFL